MVRILAFQANDPGSNPGQRIFGVFVATKARGKKPAWVKRLANERVETLLALAKKTVKKNPQRAKRYVELARKISMKYSVSISASWKKHICSKCGAFLLPGFNQTVRADRKTKCMIYVCKDCGAVKRHGYSKRKAKA